MNTAGEPETLNLHEEIARINRAIAESVRLRDKTNRFIAEHDEKMAQVQKSWSWRLSPWLIVASFFIGQIVVVILNHYWR